MNSIIQNDVSFENSKYGNLFTIQKQMITKRQNTDFGIVLTLVLLVIAIWQDINVLYKIAVATLLIAALVPVLYTPLSWFWYWLAGFAERLFSVIILFFIFYLIVVPIGLFRRWFAKDTLHLRRFKKGNGSVFSVKNKTYEARDLENQY